MRFGKKRRASVSPFFIGFPIVVMIATIGLSTTGVNPLEFGISNNAICNANSIANQTGSQCSGVNNSNLVFVTSCPIQIGSPLIVPCNITLPGQTTSICPQIPPPPSYCGPTVPIVHPVASWLLPRGTTVTILVNQTTLPKNTANGVFFNLGVIGPSGFIAIIGVIIGLVCLAGITVLGTGAGTESIHILFMGGMMMGIWLFLSGLDGFGSSNPNSFFFQLDQLNAGTGTGFYIILTFLYLVGFAGMVKRGV